MAVVGGVGSGKSALLQVGRLGTVEEVLEGPILHFHDCRRKTFFESFLESKSRQS